MTTLTKRIDFSEPHVLRTEEEYDAAVAELDALLDHSELTSSEHPGRRTAITPRDRFLWVRGTIPVGVVHDGHAINREMRAGVRRAALTGGSTDARSQRGSPERGPNPIFNPMGDLDSPAAC